VENRFAQRLLDWHARHGRHDLPWQHPRDAYRVWVSEIMLQQTQVSTVIPYFNRFIARFPNLRALADAPLDDVLAHWAGLGYYARARNLHRCAQRLCEQNGDVDPVPFPRQLDALTALPGIGRSTAAAILAQAFGERHAILDGNVKRVLSRHIALEGPPSRADNERRLWLEAERRTPQTHLADYTQAIMDLGATLCLRRNPLCERCPVAQDCAARLQGRQHELPTPKPGRTLPQRQTHFLLLRSEHGILLEKRPPQGLWGGLWSLPEVSDAGHEALAQALSRHTLRLIGEPRAQPRLRHSFSHFHLDIHPLEIPVREDKSHAQGVMEARETLWYNGADPEMKARIGLAAPVERLLNRLMNTGEAE
jgi:A/G-specific adenine glycosylase